MEWAAASVPAQRANFYSADEGAPEGQPPKQAAKAKAAKAKRPSTAQVTAEHISRMASLLPAMAAQLTELQQNQISLQQQMDLQAGQPQPRPSQMPVSMSPQQFAGIVGAPPKTKGLALSHPPPPPSKRVGLQLDSPLTVQEQAEEGVPEVDMSPLALAMLEQSRALTAIMAHLAQGDPLLDTHASGTSTSSRGAQGREKLQRELSDRTGSFFLTVMQNMFKRMKPASSVPKTIEELASTDPVNGPLSRAFWRIRQCARHGHLPICTQLCGGPSSQGRSSGPQRASGSVGGGDRAVCSGREVGLRFHADAAGRPTAPDVELSEPCWSSDREAAGICSALPAALGHYSAGLPEGDRFHPQQAAGDNKEGGTTPAFSAWAKEERELKRQSQPCLHRGGLSATLPKASSDPLPGSTMSVRPSGTAIFGRGSATDPRGISASGGFDSGKLEEDYGEKIQGPFAVITKMSLGPLMHGSKLW